MKYHKIRGVEKSVCTAEQKIAYNIAWRLQLRYRDQWAAMKGKMDEVGKSQAIMEMRDEGMYEWSFSDNGKFDNDAIFSCLTAGLRKYMDGKQSIFSNYEDIGKTFPAHYLDNQGGIINEKGFCINVF